MDSNFPIARVIRDRRTGKIVGPISQIFEEDWPFVEVPENEILWRYMELWKFEDFLKTSTLYMARPDTFLDQLEGRFSEGNKTRKSRSDEAFHDLYNIQEGDSKSYVETHRTIVFISCWHRGSKESLRMWREYTDSPQSAVVVSSVKAMRRFLPQKLMAFGVKYHPNDFPRTEFSHNSLFFYKTSDYAYEREFRILRSPLETEVFHSENPDDKFRRVPVNLKKIVHRVISHPNATRETKNRIDDLLKKYLPKLTRENSALQIGH